MIKIQEDDFEILHFSFPRTGNRWIGEVVNDYFAKMGLEYRWDFSHCSRSFIFNEFPGGYLYSYDPTIFHFLSDQAYFTTLKGSYRHLFYTYSLDYKRAVYASFRKITNPVKSTGLYARHFLEVYMQHVKHVESILSQYNYPWVTKLAYEDLLNDPVNKFSEAIGSMTLQSVIVDKDILNKIIEDWPDKDQIAGKIEYHIEPDYEEKYEEFLNNHGSMLDETYESTQIRNT